MLSMHATLRDRWGTRCLLLESSVLFASALVAIGTFMDPTLVAATGIGEEDLRIVVGLAGVALFLIGLLSMRLDPRGKATIHGEAAVVLADLKKQARQLCATHVDGADAAKFIELVEASFRGVPPIPERLFASLKARHRQKVRISRLLDRYPAAPLWLIRMRFMKRDISAVLRASPEMEEGR